MKKTVVLFVMLLIGTALIGITVSADEESEFPEDFDIPTNILPENVDEFTISATGTEPYVDLVCYDAKLTQPGDVIKTAYFKIYNAGNIYATAPFYTAILMDNKETARKLHTVSLRPGFARFCSKTFYYSQNGWHTFQCWTDSGKKFDEPDENNNFDPIPPRDYWII
ncbi:MAG: hypothetical protein FE038_00560 [Thermoplasmata archaeon]|nr:MAG: hypothetical protein FE038_00560 [Thermoplasmata archaeon]